MPTHALLVTVEDRPGMLFRITQVLAEHEADIRYVDLLHGPAGTEIFLECELGDTLGPLERIRALDGVTSAGDAPSMSMIYGKRIIIMGGGAHVGQVAIGAIA